EPARTRRKGRGLSDLGEWETSSSPVWFARRVLPKTRTGDDLPSFGAADIAEGMQRVQRGSLGDLGDLAKRPVRSVVRLHDGPHDPVRLLDHALRREHA